MKDTYREVALYKRWCITHHKSKNDPKALKEFLTGVIGAGVTFA